MYIILLYKLFEVIYSVTLNIIIIIIQFLSHMLSGQKNNSLIIENQYFGCVNYYSSLFSGLNIVIEQCETYQKAGFRNRCILAGSNGLINLTVPLENGRDQKCSVKEVRISKRNSWQQQHWRTIFSCYGNSPFFEFYSDWLEGFYQKEFLWLFDMNLEVLFWLKKVLVIPGDISFSETFIKECPANMADLRNQWVPKNFQQKDSSIKYAQVFEEKIGFQPNLSILDILFCEGPQSSQLLKAGISHF